jgi:hypothetical protein
MNTRNKISLLAFVLLLLVSPLSLKAQSEEDIASFLQAGGEDAAKLMEAYLKPMVKSLSYGIAGGWYTTAKPHKSLGFDVSLTVNMAFIPTSEKYFDPNKLGLSSNFTSFNNSTKVNQTQAPTIAGPKDDTSYTFSGELDGNTSNGNETVNIVGPEGFDLKKEIGFAAAPMPMIQLGIGVIKSTDIKIRFVPKQEVGDSEVKMFGIGVMHDIKQHIKGIKMLPFDLSALVAYNSVTGSSDLSNTVPSPGSPYSEDGAMDYKFNSWVIQALISKKVSVLTGYAGIGYSIVDTNVDVKGNYIVDASPVDFPLPPNPVAIDYKNNSMRLTLGMRLKFGPVYFNGDYTFQKYNTLSVGFGFAVR